MKSIHIFLFMVILLVACAPVLAHADDKYEAMKEMLDDKMIALTALLSPEDKQKFYVLYNNHTVLAGVAEVQQDLKNAVLSCGKNNKELGAEMKSGYATWNTGVEDLRKQAKNKLKKSLAEQSFAPKDKIKEILEHVDSVRAEGIEQFKKVPVTQEKECRKMLQTMENKKQDVLALIQSTMIDQSQEILTKRAEEKKLAPLTGDATP